MTRLRGWVTYHSLFQRHRLRNRMAFTTVILFCLQYKVGPTCVWKINLLKRYIYIFQASKKIQKLNYLSRPTASLTFFEITPLTQWGEGALRSVVGGDAATMSERDSVRCVPSPTPTCAEGKSSVFYYAYTSLLC